MMTEERKAYLAELNRVARYTAEVLHGEGLSKTRVKQYKKYFNKTYKMLHRLVDMKGEINNSSFKYGYGGKVLCRKVMLQLGFIRRKESTGRKAIYELLVPKEGITMELVSRIIVEVYLMRNDITHLDDRFLSS